MALPRPLMAYRLPTREIVFLVDLNGDWQAGGPLIHCTAEDGYTVDAFPDVPIADFPADGSLPAELQRHRQ